MKKLFLLVILAGSFAPHSFSMNQSFQNESENIEKKMEESESIEEADSSKIKDKVREHFKSFTKPDEEALLEYLHTCNHGTAFMTLQELWKKEQESLEEAGITMNEYMCCKKENETILALHRSDTFNNQLKNLIIDKGRHEIHQRYQEFSMFRTIIGRPLYQKEDGVIVDDLMLSCQELFDKGSANALEIAMKESFNFRDFIKNCDDKKKIQEEAKHLALNFKKLLEEKNQQEDNKFNDFDDELSDVQYQCYDEMIEMRALLKEKLFSLK